MAGCGETPFSSQDSAAPVSPKPSSPDSPSSPGSLPVNPGSAGRIAWYVSAGGDDSGAGTDPEQPLASVQAALARIRSQYRNENWPAGKSAVIVIRGTITGSGSFGPNESMVDISGAGNYPPIILEGDPVSGGVLNANRSRNREGRVLYIGNN
ncbi:MAG: hypothetical protein LBK40_04685, partial [Spirochaetaceae bacterium]|nr:hypothetical protein [Spirochaetaceae bacterium]